MNTNFDLAPPPKTVDGLLAVPMDIQQLTAAIVFDGAAQSGAVDATLEFTTGAQSGCPIFDLRQTITAAWLDGVSLAPARLAHHDFGGGPDARLRIVESVLPAGTVHTLRLTYTLGLPQAPLLGMYAPALHWTAGPRLDFHFGFTDLQPARYLEAWLPANLIFDQFQTQLEIRIDNTAIAHTLITNGAVTPAGANHWTIVFPASFTALSPLLELRATDTLASQSTSVTLPVSGTNVTIEAWKLTASAGIDLATELDHLRTWLTENENNIGPYLHGHRFVAFLPNSAGMEYDGGTTSSPSALRHETHHSWWARGLKPASQPDGWWDEAWTMYHDHGSNGSQPFDFTVAPVTLCPRNPWVRITTGLAYDEGEEFFKGVAALIGVANLTALMSEFYRTRTRKVVRTTDIEEFLLARSGHAGIVEAFHRFVFGFADPAPAPDLWIKDDPGHPGSDNWAGRFYDSPDLWIRHADDGGTAHQAPLAGRDNWFHARVRNRSATAAARHFVVSFNVKPYAGVQFTWPADFLPCIAAAAAFDLAPGASTVVKARWPAALVPPAGTHACWLASILTRGDLPVAGNHVWEHNNLAQKNLTILSLRRGDWGGLTFVLKNPDARRARSMWIEVVRPPALPKLAVALAHPNGKIFTVPKSLLTRIPADARDERIADAPFADCGCRLSAPGEVRDAASLVPAPRVELPFAEGPRAGQRLKLPPGAQVALTLRVQAPADALPGQTIAFDLLHRDSEGKPVVGGLAVQVEVV